MSHHYFIHYFPVTACLAVYFLHKLGKIDTEKENEYLDTKEKLQNIIPGLINYTWGTRKSCVKYFFKTKLKILSSLWSNSFKKKTPHTRLNAY